MAAGLPTSSVIEVNLNGVWTDITSYVKQLGDAIVQHQGRVSEVDDSQPGTLTLALDGIDGRFMPGSPTIVTGGVVSANPLYPYFTEDAQIRWTVTKGSAKVLFLGWITAITPNLASEPTQSTVVVSAVDTLGRLSRGPLLSGISQEILLDTPAGYWPMSEPAGSTSSADVSGNGRGPLVQTFPAPSTAACAWGQAGPGADSAGAVTVTRDGHGGGGRLIGRDVLKGVGFTALTLETWFRINPDAVSVGPFSIMYLHTNDFTVATTTGGDVGIETNYAATQAQVPLQSVMNNGATYSAFASTAIVGDGLWHHAALTVTGGIARLYLDGQVVRTVAALATLPYSSLTIGASPNYGGTSDPVSVAHVAVYTAALSAGRIAAHFAAGDVTGAAGQTVATQTAAVVSYVGVPATYEAGYGPQTACAAPCGGRTALQSLQTVVAGEGGLLYDDGTGLYFRARSALRSGTVAVTLDMEDDLDGAPTLSRATVNKVATATARSAAGSVTVTDPAAVGQVGAANVTIETSLASLGELYAVASNRVAAGLNLKTRVSQLRVNLMTAKNDLYAAFLALRPGARVRLSNAPTYLGATFVDVYALGWTLESSYDGFVYVLDTIPADAPAELRFDTFRFASDGTSTCGAMTAAVTTVVITTPGGAPTWSTNAADYPSDLLLGGERVTLNNAPGGAASPQTFTGVTRGVAPSLAVAHASGEPVEVYDCIAFAF